MLSSCPSWPVIRICDNRPARRSPLSQPPKPLIAIRSSSGFSDLRPGVFHISLRTHKKRYGQPRARREKFVTLLCSFLYICGLARTCIRAKFPQSHQERWLILSRWPTRRLSPQALAHALFCRLPCSVDWFLLFCSVLSCSGTFCLPSSSSDLTDNHVRKPFVWVSRQNRQRDPLTGTHPRPHKRIPNIVSQLALSHLVWEIPNVFLHCFSNKKNSDTIDLLGSSLIVTWILAINLGVFSSSERSEWDFRATVPSQISLDSSNCFWILYTEIFVLVFPWWISSVQHAVSKFLEEWIASWCWFPHRLFLTDSNLLHSKKKKNLKK